MLQNFSAYFLNAPRTFVSGTNIGKSFEFDVYSCITIKFDLVIITEHPVWILERPTKGEIAWKVFSFIGLTIFRM